MYTDDQIVDILKNFIDDKRIKSAIMIDGKWGCGKTHFIKEVLLPELEGTDAFKPMYIPLYGVAQEKDITETILLKKLSVKKTSEGVGTFAKLSSVVAKGVTNFFNLSDSIEDILDSINFSDLVIIFDDVERCQLSINKLFGYINNLVEHGNARCILVCNEDQIGMVSYTANIEEKYNVLLNSKISGDGDGQITKKSLDEKTKEFFRDNVLYEKTKEKLIGLTIKYQNDISRVYESIVEAYIPESKSRELLEQNKNKVIGIINEYSSKNLRTFIFAIIKFEQIIESINKNSSIDKNALDKYHVYNNILYNCIRMSIFEKEKEKRKSTFSSSLSDFFFYGMFPKMTFINEYIEKNLLDIELMSNELNAIISASKQREENSDLTYYKYYNWETMEDTEIETFVTNVTKELFDNKYDFNSCISIIILFNSFTKLEFDIDLDTIEAHIIDNMDKIIPGSTKEIVKSLRIEDETLEPIKRIYGFIKQSTDNDNSEQFNDILSKDDWAKLLLKEAEEINQILREKQFLGIFDEELLLSTIKISNNKNLYYFLECLKNVYNFSNLKDIFSSELELFEKINDTLFTIPTESEKVKCKLLDFMKEMVESILTRLKV